MLTTTSTSALQRPSLAVATARPCWTDSSATRTHAGVMTGFVATGVFAGDAIARPKNGRTGRRDESPPI
jgi:hypothetical protein